MFRSGAASRLRVTLDVIPLRIFFYAKTICCAIRFAGRIGVQNGKTPVF